MPKHKSETLIEFIQLICQVDNLIASIETKTPEHKTIQGKIQKAYDLALELKKM